MYMFTKYILISILEKIMISLKELIKNRLESSSFIVLPNVAKTGNILIKLIWIFLTISSAVACGWFISRSIMDYLNFEVITKTDIRYESNLIFPIVSICNLNLFNLKQYMATLLRTPFPQMGEFSLAQLDLFDLIAFNETNRYKYGKKIQDMIIDCKFNEETCDLDQNFEYFYDYNYGICFRFNSGKNMNGNKTVLKSSYKNGYGSGLDLELFAGSPDENMNLFSKENGFTLFISYEPIDSSFMDGISISPGFSTKIAIGLNKIIKIPKPYSNCQADLLTVDSYQSDFYKKSIIGNNNYHFMSCISVCLQKYIGDNCGCQLPANNVDYYTHMRKCGKRINNVIPVNDSNEKV